MIVKFYFLLIFRAGSCSSNKVCCINEYVNIGTTQETPIIGDSVNNNVRSCGIGKSPPSTINSDNIGTRIVNPEGTFTIYLKFKKYKNNFFK